MDDLISRRAVKELAHNQVREKYCSMALKEDCDFYIKLADSIIDLLPTIQPKRGKWIYCEDSMADCVDGYRCDQCGFFIPWDYQHKGIDYIKDYNFCPHCGSYNGGKNEI